MRFFGKKVGNVNILASDCFYSGRSKRASHIAASDKTDFHCKSILSLRDRKKCSYDILALLVRYICFANAIYPRLARMRYDKNLVSVRKHIAPAGISRTKYISQISQEIYIVAERMFRI